MLVPQNVASIEAIAAKDTSRYVINGVLLERDSAGIARAVATDGRRMIVAEFCESDEKDYPAVFDSERVEGFSAILPAGALKTAAKGIGKASRIKPVLGNIAVSEASANGQVFLTTTDLETESKATVPTIDDKYPSWREVMPKYEALTKEQFEPHRSIRIGVNAKLLAELLTTLCKINKGSENDVVTLEVPLSADRPIVVHADKPDIGKTTGLLMPVTIK